MVSARTRGSLVALTLALVSTPHLASAQAVGFALDRFNPSERGSDWFAEDSLDLRGHVRTAAGLGLEIADRPLVIYNVNGSTFATPIAYQLVFHPGASTVLWDRVRLAVDLPIAAESGTSGSVTASCPSSSSCAPVSYPAASSGLGDLRVSGDVRLVGKSGEAFTAAAGVQVFLPTGSQSAYLSDGEIRLTPRVAVAGDLGMIAYAGHLGLQVRPADHPFPGYATGTELDLGASVGLRLLGRKLLVGPELYGGTVVTSSSAAFSTRQTPLEVLLGAHYSITSSWRVGGGLAMGITRGFGEPVVRGVATIEWVQPLARSILDRDHDGIADVDDACPDVPGIPTNDPKTNGCPGDRDHDGVLDSVDACPDVPGVATSDPQTNGCPADRDHDGILDADDACPDVPGVSTNDPKTNGCPLDSDGDGIPDPEDACPNKAGPPNADPKLNGCPLDPDRDKDGIPNAADACPDDPGPPSDEMDLNGCPIAYLKDGSINLMSPVKFGTGAASATVTPNTEEGSVGYPHGDVAGEVVLQAVVKLLVNHPEVKHVRVEGHTDNQGSPAANKKLSEERAAAVVTWLVKYGIVASRLSSAGLGGERPLQPNTTEAGRKANRRIEFHVEP